MPRASRTTVFTLAVAAALSAGCSGPYIRAAGTYGDATKESAAALDTATATASRLCRTKSQMQYLQVRLGVIPATEEEAKLKFLDYYDKAHATNESTWKAYCADIDKAGQVFSGAASGLTAYGAALAALAKTGSYDGADIEAFAKSVGDIADKQLGSAPAAKAIKPVGGLLGKLAGLVINAYVDRRLKDYVTAAEPVVQSLVGAMEGYIQAVDADLAALTQHGQRETMKAFEAKLGLVGQNGDPAKLLDFYRLALATDDDIRATRATIAGYSSVLAKMKTAHTALRNAAQSSDHETEDLKKALGEIADLIGKIGALQGAFANKE